MRYLATYRLLLIALLLPAAVTGQDLTAAAAHAYARGEYDVALGHLSNIEGLLTVAPRFDRVKGEDRARVLFDLARCRFALEDSAGARLVLGELFRTDPRQTKGGMDVESDAARTTVLEELRALRRETQQARISKTSAFKAGMRSVVLPGWGQHYRGRKARGRLLTISTAVLAAGWFITDRSYRSALETYRRTSELDLNLPSRTGGPDDPNPFQERFEKAESRASTARAFGLTLGSVWIYSIAENFVLRPGRVTLTIPID